ncbi:MAG: hypothetical protein V2A77_08615 [Pseudomonadota bacterium]
MFPWVFEWDWEIGHYCLLGAWYCVCTVVGVTLLYTILKTASDLRNKRDRAGHGDDHGHH